MSRNRLRSQNKAIVTLQKIVNNLQLPQTIDYDFKKFADNTYLYNYQIEAIQNATKLLCKYFNKEQDSPGNLFLLDNYTKYADYQFESLSIDNNDLLYNLLSNYFKIDNNKLHYSHFLNRMNFWMATGSGKTLVMIKLIAIIARLMSDKLIPTKPIMILAPDDNILKQIKKLVDKYNLYTSTNKIDLVDLKDNWEQDNNLGSCNLLDKLCMRVYYYKSNNFVADKSDVASSKEGKNIYFDSYRNTEGWYLFLDEAHRGEDSKSKRKGIFNILSQNGFMFNFSATFTDDIDILSTIYDKSLPHFLQDGYGKKLYISNTEINNLSIKANDNMIVDANQFKKRKTIAKTILLLALQRKNASQIKQIDSKLYHMPLMLVLAGQVNSEDRGLKPFFNFLIEMVKDEWQIIEAKKELAQEVSQINEGSYINFKFHLGDEVQISSMCHQISELEVSDIWKYVFGGLKSKIEVITYEKNKNEVAFKLKTANEPFALLVISEAISWIKNDTSGVFEFVNKSINSSIFDKIDSTNNIAILLGSQMFKEGWDSNRPNIVCYLGIGKNADNKKYVMQTIGRGIRIEPLPNQRQRFEYCNKDKLSIENIRIIRKLSPIIETEFIFATDSSVINEIWTIIQEQGSKEEWNDEINRFFKINKKLTPKQLLVPQYKPGDTLNDNPFRTSITNKDTLEAYIKNKSKKILILKHELSMRSIGKIFDPHNMSGSDNKNIPPSISVSENKNIPQYKPEYLIESINEHFNKPNQIIERFIYLSSEIKHYENIATNLTDGDLNQLENELKQIIFDANTLIDENKLLEKLENKTINVQEYSKKLASIKEYKENQVQYKFIKNINDQKKLFQYHYYQPLIFINDEYLSRFKHIVKVTSEIEFLNDLCNYQTELNNKYEWWYFTKVDETLDNDIGINYFDASSGKSRKFYPDFIFWLKSKQNGKLTIKFVDPKGGEHQNNPFDKAKGFEELFNDQKISKVNNSTAVKLYFYNKDDTVGRSLDDNFKEYWASTLEKIFEN